ncbi:MAG: tetratricopeptide repeat protein [Anaeromyxobacteraceae bacterium]
MYGSLALKILALVLLSIPAMARAQAPSADVKAALARADAAWPERDQPGKLEAMRTDLEAAERAAPDDYGVLWRLSRLYFWLSDDLALPDAEKSKLGKKGWELGDRATAANPNGVEGWFYAVGGMGNYSLGIGILNALSQGIEGKFKERLSKAEAIDPGFNAGGIANAWGRFYYKLPWPKYDAKKSESSLRKAIKTNPDNVRARVYLAELYQKENHPKEARKLLEEAIAHEPGRYDAPEERRYQQRAKELLAQH